MASFDIAYRLTSINEGGYVANLGDGAGETYCGITRNNWPKWEGWIYLDQAKRSGIVKKGTIFAAGPLPNLVKSFYKTNHWDKVQGDGLNTQEIANLTYDWVVNSGSALPTIHQAIANGAKESIKASSSALTQSAVAAANSAPVPVYSSLWNARKAYYIAIAKKPGYSQFLNTWLNRLNTFPQTLKPAIQTSNPFFQSLLKFFGL